MIKYFHRNEILVVFAILVLIFCQMFFSEYFNALDDFAKNKNNVVYKIDYLKHQDSYVLRYMKDYATEYLDKIAPIDEDAELVEMVGPYEYVAKNQDELNGELYGVLFDNTIEDLYTELDFALSLDTLFKRVSEEYANIESIYYSSKNNFVFKWPKSTSSALNSKYRETSTILDNDDFINVIETDGTIESEINVFDKSNNYYGVINYTYDTNDAYSFLDDSYKCLIKDVDGKIIYTNLGRDLLTDEVMVGVNKVFSASEQSGNKDEILVVGTKYYYIYTFEDGMQILQYVNVFSVLSQAFKATIPVILIALTYIVFLLFKSNYEQSTEKLNDAMEELDRSYDKLKIMANTDFLTNMHNRAGFTETVNKMLEKDTKISFVMADIDKFKNVNDTYGHEIGDIVLKEFAEVLKNSIKPFDAVGRWGGEEFVIAFSDVSEDVAYTLTNEIRKKVLNIEVDTGEKGILKISASFGVAVHDKKIDFLDTLNRADEALYFAKENGRNQVTRYSNIQS